MIEVLFIHRHIVTEVMERLGNILSHTDTLPLGFPETVNEDSGLYPQVMTKTYGNLQPNVLQ